MELIEGVAEIEDVDRLIERLGEIGATYDCVITAFDARYLVGREHIERAVHLAKRAFERGENVAETRSIEVLLYAAGSRQIDRALEIGVSAGEGPIVVCIGREGSDRGTRGEQTDAADERPTEAEGDEDDTGTGDVGADDSEVADLEDLEGAENGTRERAAAAAVRRALGPDFDPDEVLGAYDETLVRDFFAIGEAELEATDVGIADLVIERVVLLDVEK